MVSHRANPDGELVTGNTQDRGDTPYFTVPNAVAFAAATLSVILLQETFDY